MKAKKSLFLSCLMVVATCCLLKPVWSASLSFTPESTFVDVGDNFAVEIWINELGTDELGNDVALGAFDLTINFEPTMLAFDTYSLGIGLGYADNFEVLDFSGLVEEGSLNLWVTSLLTDLSSQPDDPLLLATVTFSALSAGTSALSFDALYDLGDALGDPIEADFSNGTVTVNPSQTAPVPEPATGLLFGMGIAGLAALQRRCRQQHS